MSRRYYKDNYVEQRMKTIARGSKKLRRDLRQALQRHSFALQVHYFEHQRAEAWMLHNVVSVTALEREIHTLWTKAKLPSHGPTVRTWSNQRYERRRADAPSPQQTARTLHMFLAKQLRQRKIARSRVREIQHTLRRVDSLLLELADLHQRISSRMAVAAWGWDATIDDGDDGDSAVDLIESIRNMKERFNRHNHVQPLPTGFDTEVVTVKDPDRIGVMWEIKLR